MKNYARVIKYSELILIVFVWLVLIITPVLFRDDYNNPVSRSIYNQIEILVPLSLLFLINRFLFVPKLLFRGRWIFFIGMVLGFILLLTVGSYLFDTRMKRPGRPGPEYGQILHGTSPIPDNEDRQRPRPDDKMPPGSRQPRPMPPFANFLILSVLVVGFDTGLRSGLRWIQSENEKMILEKENASNQLVMLRNQISPHFFMNTLNNIHALIDISTSEAKESIIKLSRMMRYLLYETEADRTTLKKEIEFIESFIDLMRLRFSQNVRITLNIPPEIPDRPMPPLLFTSFIENAFKHGISYTGNSFISIDIVTGDERLLFVIKNSKPESPGNGEYAGIGIQNTHKRLDILFGQSYHLDIIDGVDQFTVNLSIPL